MSDGVSPVARAGATDRVTAGGCLCGGIRFEITGTLAPIQVCHCKQCRKAQGGPLVTVVPIPVQSFRLLSGPALLSEFESSPGKLRVFCRRCGSPIFSRRESEPNALRIRAGTLEGPLETRPAVHFHVRSAANWWPILDALPQYPEGIP